MFIGPLHKRRRSGSVSCRARIELIAAVLCTLVATLSMPGCVTAPGQPAVNAIPATPDRDDATANVTTVQTQVTPASNDFHRQPTDRQRFQVHVDFGRVFETQGNLDAAVLEYQDALTVAATRRHGALGPADEALAHRRMAGALDRLGRFAQAETHYQKACKLSPKDAKIWNDAGYSYYLQGRWDDAERAFRTAVRLAPEDNRIRTNLGLALAAAGRSEEALPLLSQSNGDAIGHANLGYLLAASGQLDLARSQYETALALRPDLEIARRALARIDLDQTQKRVAAASSTAPPPPIPPATRSTAHPAVDPGISQVSGPRVKIPPPTPKRFLLPDPADVLSKPAGGPDAAAPIELSPPLPR
jgi:Flp pilus assembly protein TadD